MFDGLVTEAIEAYDRIVGLDLSETAVDGSQHKAPCGGQGTGTADLFLIRDAACEMRLQSYCIDPDTSAQLDSEP